MKKYLHVLLTTAFLLVSPLSGCGQKEQAEQESEVLTQREEETGSSSGIEESEGMDLKATPEDSDTQAFDEDEEFEELKDVEPSGMPEEEADLEETVEGPHAKAFDEGEEIEEVEGVYEEEPIDEEEWEEEPLPEDTQDE